MYGSVVDSIHLDKRAQRIPNKPDHVSNKKASEGTDTGNDVYTRPKPSAFGGSASVTSIKVHFNDDYLGTTGVPSPTHVLAAKKLVPKLVRGGEMGKKRNIRRASISRFPTPMILTLEKCNNYLDTGALPPLFNI